MYTGKGTLVLRDGQTLPLSYQFSSDYDDIRAGYLFCDTSDVDPAELGYSLRIICEDGIQIDVAVIHSSDRYLAVTGRVAPLEAA
ncbi:hypothetical protein FQV39_05600 [Bosea sp. F3-2]|uniref:hypothetical protein n=1 Tax=Bosea sp. F3-2 TaxID=2599640 RepID=UPI0011EF132E|nr:hypothetical protein [Bosea sp. F3-2]QEL22095.1 hypothetical protein FQV39_05600 [Bosea sp. F3-2]